MCMHYKVISCTPQNGLLTAIQHLATADGQFKETDCVAHNLCRIDPALLQKPSETFLKSIQTDMGMNGRARVVVYDSGRTQGNKFWNIGYTDNIAKENTGAGVQIVFFVFPDKYTGKLHRHEGESVSHTVHIGTARELVELHMKADPLSLSEPDFRAGYEKSVRKQSDCTKVPKGEFHQIVIQEGATEASVETPQFSKWLKILGIEGDKAGMVSLLHAYAVGGQDPNAKPQYSFDKTIGGWAPIS